MSLDGFITGPNDERGNGLGVDGHRLHDWLADGTDPASQRPSGGSGEVFDELMATGAVVVGRRTFEIARAVRRRRRARQGAGQPEGAVPGAPSRSAKDAVSQVRDESGAAWLAEQFELGVGRAL
jgi:dihydrofolate reductase